jgi:hypothetical protein
MTASKATNGLARGRWYGSGDNARAVYRWFPSTLVNTKKVG